MLASRRNLTTLMNLPGFHYQAKSWDRRRRVVAKVEEHANELTRAWASSSRIFRGKQGKWSSS